MESSTSVTLRSEIRPRWSIGGTKSLSADRASTARWAHTEEKGASMERPALKPPLPEAARGHSARNSVPFRAGAKSSLTTEDPKSEPVAGVGKKERYQRNIQRPQDEEQVHGFTNEQLRKAKAPTSVGIVSDVPAAAGALL